MTREPGIYFGLPEEEYHADPSFSASGIRDITVSPLDYWANSWMNPDKEESDSSSQKLGKAYHKLILEGREAFDACYAVKPDKEDYPDALDGAQALKDRCEEMGLKKSGSIAELCARIREADGVVQLWPEIEAEFKEEAGEREVLTKKQWRDLKLVELVMRRSPSTEKAFVGGVPEVSLFWHEGDVPMKARIDYVKPAGLLDLKSFANMMNDEIVSAVTKTVARHRYYIQPPVYTTGFDRMKALFKTAGDGIFHGGTEEQRAVVRAALGQKETKFWFVFLETSGVPNVVVREFAKMETYRGLGGTTNAYWYRGEAAFRYGLATYRRCMKEFGTEQPWIADFGLKSFKDEDFPIWMLSVPNMEAAE